MLATVLVALSAGQAVAGDYYRDQQWALDAFNAEAIWKISTGAGVTVAVLDSGVDSSHPDLTGQVLPGENAIEGADPADVADPLGHGTRMAGLIVGKGHGPDGSQGIKGLAPEAKVLPVKILTPTGMGAGDPVATGIRYAVDHSAKVINISALVDIMGQSVRDALRYAIDKDVIVVAGIGNSGDQNEIGLPSMPGVVSVGGVDKNAELWKSSSWSSHLTILAPAAGIISTAPGGGYSQGDGTSDATAYVSAAAALVRAKFPQLTAGQVINRLVKSAGLPPSDKGKSIVLPDPHLGYGFVQPLTALTRTIDPGPAAGPLPQQTSSAAPAGTQRASSGSGNSGVPIGVLLLSAVGIVVLLVVVLVLVVVNRRASRARQASYPGQQYPPQY